MLRKTDFTHPNPPNDIPQPPFMMPWPRKPLGGKGKPAGKTNQPSRSGLHKLTKRVTHPDPFF